MGKLIINSFSGFFNITLIFAVFNIFAFLFNDELIFHIFFCSFTCDACREAKGIGKRKPNRFNARQLQQTKLGEHIETRVNKYLEGQECSEAGYVTIRIVSSQDKNVEVRQGMRTR